MGDRGTRAVGLFRFATVVLSSGATASATVSKAASSASPSPGSAKLLLSFREHEHADLDAQTEPKTLLSPTPGSNGFRHGSNGQQQSYPPVVQQAPKERGLFQQLRRVDQSYAPVVEQFSSANPLLPRTMDSFGEVADEDGLRCCKGKGKGGGEGSFLRRSSEPQAAEDACNGARSVSPRYRRQSVRGVAANSLLDRGAPTAVRPPGPSGSGAGTAAEAASSSSSGASRPEPEAGNFAAGPIGIDDFLKSQEELGEENAHRREERRQLAPRAPDGAEMSDAADTDMGNGDGASSGGGPDLPLQGVADSEDSERSDPGGEPEAEREQNGDEERAFLAPEGDGSLGGTRHAAVRSNGQQHSYSPVVQQSRKERGLFQQLRQDEQGLSRMLCSASGSGSRYFLNVNVNAPPARTDTDADLDVEGKRDRAKGDALLDGLGEIHGPELTRGEVPGLAPMNCTGGAESSGCCGSSLGAPGGAFRFYDAGQVRSGQEGDGIDIDLGASAAEKGGAAAGVVAATGEAAAGEDDPSKPELSAQVGREWRSPHTSSESANSSPTDSSSTGSDDAHADADAGADAGANAGPNAGPNAGANAGANASANAGANAGASAATPTQFLLTEDALRDHRHAQCQLLQLPSSLLSRRRPLPSSDGSNEAVCNMGPDDQRVSKKYRKRRRATVWPDLTPALAIREDAAELPIIAELKMKQMTLSEN